ncbi:peptidase M24, structural domain-containing protein [Sporodiniella umbellata]|nr:peptidase M24, structural domain-containing protein [Sporodiniella umbellata]
MTPHPISLKPMLAGKKTKKLPTRQHYLKIKRLMNLKGVQQCGIYMQGKQESTRDGTDVSLEFRQESYFFYLTGVDEPDFQVLIDLHLDKIYLIAPDIPLDDIGWRGPGTHPTELLEKYDIDEVIRESELPSLLIQLQLHTLFMLHRDQPPASIACNTRLLLPAMDEARLIKFPWEIDLIRQATYASSQAHLALIQQYRPGMTEGLLAALFRWTCALHGAYRQAYLPIVASGPRASTLHHAPHFEQPIPNDPHSLILVDAGGEKSCYGSDITRTFPVQGVFSPEAKVVYQIVLTMQKTVLCKLKPGIYWESLQQLAIRILCESLLQIGILVGELDLLLELGVPCAFYYHGLGHTLGLDVHDVGGKVVTRLEENTPSEFLSDRPLEKNMVLTVEPGLYFNEPLLDIWTQHPDYQQFFNLDRLNQYKPVGGVRIEDTIVITEDGYENLTHVPKEIQEIQALMNAYIQ